MAGYERLFQPGKIGALDLRNRIVMGAINTSNVDETGCFTDRHTAYLAERAKGGAALITTDGISPHPDGRHRATQFTVSDDRHIPHLRELAAAVHAHGAKISAQLMHGGMRASEGGMPEVHPIGPSAQAHFLTGVMPREASKDDIAFLVDAFGQAAYRFRSAGFDAVEMHAAHGYLGSQFLSPYTNKRHDEYGGSVENRCRFAVEVVERIKQLCGRDFPVIIKMNGDDQFPGGVTLDDALAQARILAAAGYDALIVSAGLRQSVDWQVQPYTKEIPAFTHLPAAIKQVVDVPVIAVGRIKTPALAEQVLREGKADFVCIARALIADPNWPTKAAEGRSNEIAICIGENYGCMDRDYARYPSVTCTINPAVGCEDQFRSQPTSSPKRVLVVGGGLGGMRAAATLAERGHQVVLCEQSGRLGGAWNALSGQRTELRAIVNHLRQQMVRHGVVVKLNERIDAEAVRREHPDALVVAAPARPIMPEVDKGDRSNVTPANAVLLGLAETGTRVAVLGCDVVAVETALALARQGKTVSLVTDGKTAGKVGFSLRTALLRDLLQAGVHLFDYVDVVAIAEDQLALKHDKDMLTLPADTVLYSLGFEPDSRLAKELSGLVPETHAVDDGYDPASALEAIRQGTLVGMGI